MQLTTPALSIIECKPEWAGQFGLLSRVLRRALGPLAIRVDHIGSTSVPGMPSKDIIDVQVGVLALDEASLRRPLEAAGFTWRADIAGDPHPSWNTDRAQWWSKRFAQSRPPLPPANVHLRVMDSEAWRSALYCRDYLRGHPEIAASYGHFKRRLIQSVAGDRAAYCNAKDAAYDMIAAAAAQWAERVGWSPPDF